MKTLVIAEHDNASLKAATLNAVAAANALGGDVDILVAAQIVVRDNGSRIAGAWCGEGHLCRQCRL